MNIPRKNPYTESLKQKQHEGIKKLACKIAKDYPDIEEKNDHEMLWAIEASYVGLEEACSDYFILINKISEKYGIPMDDIISMSKKIISENPISYKD